MRANSGKWVWVTGTVLCLILAATATSTGEEKPSEDTLAVVNGSVITQADLDVEMAEFQQRLSKMGRLLNDSQFLGMKKRFLENLVERELLYQESQKEEIEVDEAALEIQLRALEKKYRRTVAVQEFIDKKFAVTEEEMRAYYESDPRISMQPAQVQASHILIKMNPAADESQEKEARRKIEEIQNRLNAGEDFASLAGQFSECPSGAKGGELGYLGQGRMPKPFEEAAFTLEPGETSEIVKTPFGYHLIKVLDKKPESTVAYEQVSEEIEQRLRLQKTRKEMRQYIEKLKEAANVERFLTEAPQ